MFMTEEFLRNLPSSGVNGYMVGTDVFMELPDIHQAGVQNVVRAILAGWSVNNIGTVKYDLAFPVPAAPDVYVVCKEMQQKLLPPATEVSAEPMPVGDAEPSVPGPGRGLREPIPDSLDDVVAPAAPPVRRAWKPAIVARRVDSVPDQPTPVEDTLPAEPLSDTDQPAS